MGIIRHESSGNLLTLEMTTAIQNYDHEASITLFGENGYIQLGGVALNKLLEVQCYNSTIDSNYIRDKYSLEVRNGYGLGHRDLLSSIHSDFVEDHDSISRAAYSFHTAQIINSSYSSCSSNWTSISTCSSGVVGGRHRPWRLIEGSGMDQHRG
jgi:UDP-N-acetyl-2-amino-2-deoxyglucuronate dehydrogenase